MSDPLASSDVTTPVVDSARKFFLSGRLFIVIAVINIAIYLWQVVSGVDWMQPDMMTLINWGANVPPLTLMGEPWRLFTSMFLHGGLLHLLANMYMLMLCGLLVERTFGTWSFGAIYLVSGVAGSLLSAFWSAEKTAVGGLFMNVEYAQLVVSVGASGALMGLAGAFVARRLIVGPDIGEDPEAHKPHQAIWQIIGINVVLGAITPGVDQACHVGGLLAGAVMGMGFAFVNEQASTAQKILARGGITVVALLALSSTLLDEPSEELHTRRANLLEQLKEAEAEATAATEQLALNQAIAEDEAKRPPPVDAKFAKGVVIDLGMAPEAMVLSRNGRYLYVTHNDENALSIVDTAARHIVKTFSGGDFAKDKSGCMDNYCRGRGATGFVVSPDEHYAYVASMRADAIVALDLQSGKVIASMPVERFPRDIVISSDGNHGYVLNSVANSVSFLDLATHKTLGKAIQLEGGDAGGYPFGRTTGLWISKDDRNVYVHNALMNRVESIDTQTREVQVVVETPEGLLSGDYHAEQQHLLIRGSQSLLSYRATEQITTTMPLCQRLESFNIAISPDNEYVAIADKQRYVHVIKLATRKTVGVYPTGDWPSQLLFAPNGETLFVANAGSKSISMLDLNKSLAVDTVQPLLCDIEQP